MAMPVAATDMIEYARCALTPRSLTHTARWISAMVQHAAILIDQTIVIQLMMSCAGGCSAFLAHLDEAR